MYDLFLIATICGSVLLAFVGLDALRTWRKR